MSRYKQFKYLFRVDQIIANCHFKVAGNPRSALSLLRVVIVILATVITLSFNRKAVSNSPLKCPWSSRPQVLFGTFGTTKRKQSESSLQ